MTKIGIEMKNRVLARTRLSMKPPLRSPASMPAPIPITTSMRMAMAASLAVVG